MPLPPPIAAALLAGDTVVTSSARAARALRRLHGEAKRSQGQDAWQSADILDWDSWMNRLWQKQVRSGNEGRLLLNNLQEQQLWTQVVRPGIEGRRLISVAAVAELAQQAYALLYAYGALGFLRGEWPGGPDVESFRAWAVEFERICSRDSLLSRSRLPLVLQEAISAGTLELITPCLLTGFDRITPAQQQLMDAVQFASHVTDLHQVSASPTTLLVDAPHERDEIATCALWVKHQLDTDPSARIAVVVPGVAARRSEIERIFCQILAPASVTIANQDIVLPFEFSLGVPLASVPMARSALLLLHWMSQPLLQSQISWLLLSGFLYEQAEELLPVAEFDVDLRRQVMRQPEQDLQTFLESAHPPHPLRHRLLAARRLLVQHSRLTFAQWAGVVENILEAVHWPGAHLLHSEDFQVLARWNQLLDNLCTLAFDGRTVGYGAFLEVLERQAQHTIFAPESRDAPVQIIGPLEAAGLTFDAMWFLGADEANWPAVGRPHPFLTRMLQRAHNMPHADSAADWQLAQQVTIRLQRSALQCVFSYAVQNKAGTCRPSTLVTMGLGNTGVQTISPSALQVTIGAGKYPGDDELPPPTVEDEAAAVVPWPTEQDAGGAEILRRQAACPFQSFAARRLGARPMDATDWGLEARERGTVIHTILQQLWTALTTRDALLAARMDGTLHTLVDQQVKAALTRFRTRTQEHTWSQAYLDAEEERIVALIEEWLAYEARRASFTVEAGEEKLSATVGDLKLRVRVDRIDAVAGGRVIIDYKTGMLGGISWDGSRPDEPQLPLYAGFGQIQDLKGVLLAGVRVDSVKFVGCVEDAALIMPGASKLAKPPYSAQMLQGWQNVLQSLGQQFLNGEAQVDPKQYPKTCLYCELPGLCRIAENDPAASSEDGEDNDD